VRHWDDVLGLRRRCWPGLTPFDPSAGLILTRLKVDAPTLNLCHGWACPGHDTLEGGTSLSRRAGLTRRPWAWLSAKPRLGWILDIAAGHQPLPAPEGGGLTLLQRLVFAEAGRPAAVRGLIKLDILEMPPAIEALMAFLLDVSFAALFILGRDRMSKVGPLGVTWPLAQNTNLSAPWIVLVSEPAFRFPSPLARTLCRRPWSQAGTVPI